MSRPINPRFIAFYLPQYHPVAENSEWWGAGFTEWHNVAKARPLYAGHIQPKLPGELGFYDLRLAQTRKDQAALAKAHGIHGFCYWHYWFGGRRLLETPGDQMLASGEPDFPFCLGWANESWTGIWHGKPKSMLVEQTYPDRDADAHYALLRGFFHDPRYIKDRGRPLFYVYKPRLMPADGEYLRRLRALACADGFPDLFILGTWTPNPGGRFDTIEGIGIDAAIVTNISGRDSHSRGHYLAAIGQKLSSRFSTSGPARVAYAVAAAAMVPRLSQFAFPAYNSVVSNWDNTPRSGRRGLVLTGSSPAAFKSVLMTAIENLQTRPYLDNGNDYIFLKSWNEWAEGNYLEPDQSNGRAYLESLAQASLGNYGLLD